MEKEILRRRVASEILVLAKEVLSESTWEAPRGDRKEWRRNKPDGSYEYSYDKPEDRKPAKEEATKKQLLEKVEKKIEEKHTEKKPVGEGFSRVDSGADFRKIIERCKKNNKDGASVELKDKYPDDWTFLSSRDGSACVAVTDDGDIVSVAKEDGSKEKHWGTRAVMEAIKHGGKKLDCFDTKLPSWYSGAGMRVVARLKWNDEYKPERWDYERNKEYNNGRPDVVFMVYDGGSKEYSKGEGAYVDTYDEGKAAQIRYMGKRKEGTMKKADEEKNSVKDYGYSKEINAAIEMGVKSLMKNMGLTREEAEKAASDS